MSLVEERKLVVQYMCLYEDTTIKLHYHGFVNKIGVMLLPIACSFIVSYSFLFAVHPPAQMIHLRKLKSKIGVTILRCCCWLEFRMVGKIQFQQVIHPQIGCVALNFFFLEIVKLIVYLTSDNNESPVSGGGAALLNFLKYNHIVT